MNKGIKIFIVEDEIIAAESLTIDLQKLGYQVVGRANTKEKAIAKIKETEPNLVLMDIKIKGEEDGINTAQALENIASIPVVYLTAYADSETLKRATKTSPYGYLVKPYKIDDLNSTINIALNKYQEIQEAKKQLTQYQEKLNYATKYDDITKLPNQLSLVENFNAILEVFYQQLIYNSELENNNIPQIIPIFYLNFNCFKLIRDQFGQELGNMLLKALVKRLQANISEDAVLARLQGDDFALIIPPIISKQEAINLARKLLENITPPFLYKEQEIYMNFNIGISFYPLQGENIDQLLYKANEAIKEVSKLGENQYQIYSPALHQYNEKEVLLEAQLHHAIAKNELELYYQPQVELKTKKIIGAEALLRWYHPQEKFISPAVFIPIAEKTGLIEKIGEWVINTACKQFKIIQQQINQDLCVSVNLSARQFNLDILEHNILKILAENYFNPNLLEVELTESLVVKNENYVSKKLKKLKRAGLKIAIDDFGTGYSSLGYLQTYEFDTLKIDRSFVKDINLNQKNATITKSLIEMAHQLNLTVVAEGIETKEELKILTDYNCDYCQGYLFSRPLPFTDFQELLKKGNSINII